MTGTIVSPQRAQSPEDQAAFEDACLELAIEEDLHRCPLGLAEILAIPATPNVTSTVAARIVAGHQAVSAWQAMSPRYRNADTYNPARRRAAREPGRWPGLDMAYAHGRGPRTEGRDWKPTEAHLKEMREAHGTLVLLTAMHPEFDAVSLFTTEGRTAITEGSRAKCGAWMSVKGKGCRKFTASLHRGGRWGVTHTHAATPLEGLSQTVRRALQAAPRGPGGGVILTSGAGGLPMVHGEIIEDGPADLERVARYLCQFPDGAARLPVEDERHMDMLEEMSQADPNGVNLTYRIRKGWRPGKSL